MELRHVNLLHFIRYNLFNQIKDLAELVNPTWLNDIYNMCSKVLSASERFRSIKSFESVYDEYIIWVCSVDSFS